MAGAISEKYDHAAPSWSDKMRVLGYYDGYLGFLSDGGYRAPAGQRVLDIGAGTAAFSEAWVAIQGPQHEITLLEPSAAMADRGRARLARRGVATEIAAAPLEAFEDGAGFDVLLAAHVIEHGEAGEMLAAMRRLARPGARLWLVVSKPHWCNAIIWLQWRHRTYRPERLKQLLAEAGWTLETTYAFGSGPPSRTSHGYVCRAG